MDGHYHYYKFWKQGQSTCILETFKASEKNLELNSLFSYPLKPLFYVCLSDNWFFKKI